MLFTLIISASMAAAPPPVVGGETTSDYPAAVMLFTGSGTCTGTLIAPSWVLTAAHCVKGNESPGQLTAYVGSEPDGGELDDMARVDEVFYHPDYDPDLSDGADVGLAHLAVPLDTVEPMPLTRATLDDSWAGRDVRYVGYGVTSEEANDSGTKRTVVVPFYQLDENWMFTFDAGHNMCWGDSGGPALVEENGELALAGVISWVGSWDDVDRPCSTGWGSSTRIDTVRDWIESYTAVRYASDTGSATPWDTGDPAADTGGTAQTPDTEHRAGMCGLLPGSGGGLLGLVLLTLAHARRRSAGREPRPAQLG